jgi:predicted N-acetyltransferase YhbS
MIATHPRLRGTGLGRKLLARVTSDADARGLPLFLEASDTGVRALYEQFGFETLKMLPVKGPGPPGEITLPLMLRLPRGNAGAGEAAVAEGGAGVRDAAAGAGADGGGDGAGGAAEAVRAG